MTDIHRRRLLRVGAAMGGGAALAGLAPAWARAATSGHAPAAQPAPGAGVLTGPDIALTIDRAMVSVDGRMAHAATVNGLSPGPLIRLKEGQKVRLSVTNRLAEETSIHWHGLLVPFQMDGVPGVSFPGIKPGETFVYEFTVRQSGTYWYHSHSGLQEAEGLYGPIVIDPKEAEPAPFDREHVVVLADFSFTHPHQIFKRLKQQPGVFNFRKQTLGGLLAGRDQTARERLSWARMRMDPTDIADVTGAEMKFLVNGRGPADGWTGLFTPGERVRLRLVNAAAQMIFNVRLPGLKMTVVSADGQDVRPVEVDELQIGNAETYDVIVRPAEDRAYALVAEAVDRSGMGRGALAPRPGMSPAFPPLRERPLATMKDMGMDMGAHASGGGMDHAGMDHAAMGHDMAGMAAAPAPGMAPPRARGSDVMGEMNDMPGMSMAMRDPANAPGLRLGPGVQAISPMPADRTGEAGQGLESVGHRVLVYRDLVALAPNADPRPPSRALDIRLTGNMERFMWGFDGRKFSEAVAPYAFERGERVRVTLINDTMMAHPIHLHGHFFELAHGPAGHAPRKHTVIVAPGGKVAWDFTAEAGDWAFHCHMIYHMHAGMFQVFSVRPLEGAAA
ncbi:MAG: copper resistance system multicopper oxidase [Caulobacteraceae bacterium]|nr:copper resistance system multicopper oxidase [Caulobacteraceae bacterium]